MTEIEVKNLLGKLRILRFPPQSESELQIYIDEFKDCEKELFEKTISELLKTKVDFPKPAEIWKIYNRLLFETKMRKGFLYCQNCSIVFEILYEHIDKATLCPNCKNELQRLN